VGGRHGTLPSPRGLGMLFEAMVTWPRSLPTVTPRGRFRELGGLARRSGNRSRPCVLPRVAADRYGHAPSQELGARTVDGFRLEARWTSNHVTEDVTNLLLQRRLGGDRVCMATEFRRTIYARVVKRSCVALLDDPE